MLLWLTCCADSVLLEPSVSPSHAGQVQMAHHFPVTGVIPVTHGHACGHPAALLRIVFLLCVQELPAPQGPSSEMALWLNHSLSFLDSHSLWLGPLLGHSPRLDGLVWLSSLSLPRMHLNFTPIRPQTLNNWQWGLSHFCSSNSLYNRL